MILALVMAHSEARAAVVRHLPIWRRFADRVVITTPHDSELYIDGIEQVTIGQKSHHGEVSAGRISLTLRWALTQEWDVLQLHEYDSLCLAPGPVVHQNEIAALRYKQNKPWKYRGEFYLHYPHFYSRHAAQSMLALIPKVRQPDRWMSDRLLGVAAKMAHVSVNNLRANGTGWSKNTIEAAHYPQMIERIKAGARYIHGIKTEECLNLALGALPAPLSC